MGAAKAVSVVTPTTGLPAASAMPRAAERPTRKPVKLPGPVVTAMRSSVANEMPDSFMTHAISGIKASAWPRFMACDWCAISLPASVSSTPAAQASSAVSMARISMGGGRMVSSEWRMKIQWRAPIAIHCSLFVPKSHRPDFDHVGHEMPQQVLDAVLQRRGGGRATRAGALHVEIDDTVLEAAERDVAAVIGDCRAHPRFDQVLDGRNGIGVILVEEFALFVGGLVAAGTAVGQQWRAGHVVLHDGAQDRRLEMLPVAVVLGYRDEVGTVK